MSLANTSRWLQNAIARVSHLPELANDIRLEWFPQKSPVRRPYIERNEFHSLFAQEWHRYVRRRWKERWIAPAKQEQNPALLADCRPTTELNLFGLALSGGGVRSATFNLGLLQILARCGLLKYCDYLSTVSGGGYIGACLTAHLSRDNTGLEGNQFPFAYPRTGKEREEVRHLREHSNYLALGQGFSKLLHALGLAGNYLSSLLVILPIPLAALVIVAFCLDFLSWHLGDELLVIPVVTTAIKILGSILFLHFAYTWVASRFRRVNWLEVLNPWIPLIVGVLINLVAIYLAESSGSYWKVEEWGWNWSPGDKCGAYRDVSMMDWLRCLLLHWAPDGLHRALVISAVLMFTMLLLSTPCMLVSRSYGQKDAERRAILTKVQEWALFSILVAGLLFILPVAVHKWSVFWDEEGWKKFGKWAFSALSLAFTLGANRNWRTWWLNKVKIPIINVGVAAFLISLMLTILGLYQKYEVETYAAACAVLIIVFFFVDPEKASLHFPYRDRLAEAYVVKPSRAGGGFVPDHDLKLATLFRTASEGEKFLPPYPLINSTINLTRRDDSALGWRKGHLFQFSPLYCGSDVTGWRATDVYEGGRMDLATAMAISGAAVGSRTGMYTSRPLAILMTLLNIRLGSWRQNPRGGMMFGTVGLLFRELFGQLSADSSAVNISDGGHFENLGLYGLIQRRCKFIIVSDAGADGQFGFGDLGNALRKIRIDFGVRVDNLGVSSIKPDSQSPDGFSRAYCAIGEIIYPLREGDKQDGEEKGILVYIKPAIKGDEATDILAYRGKRKEFPHETTADQFFDESQFESYRALGHHIGKVVFEPARRILDNETKLKKKDAGYNVLGKVFSSLLTHWKSVEHERPVP